jgi:hypothetical protein
VFVTTKVRNNSHRLSGSNPLSRRAASALVETWQALERIVEGQCKAIGLSNINLERSRAHQARGRIPAGEYCRVGVEPGDCHGASLNDLAGASRRRRLR